MFFPRKALEIIDISARFKCVDSNVQPRERYGITIIALLFDSRDKELAHLSFFFAPSSSIDRSIFGALRN